MAAFILCFMRGSQHIAVTNSSLETPGYPERRLDFYYVCNSREWVDFAECIAQPKIWHILDLCQERLVGVYGNAEYQGHGQTKQRLEFLVQELPV